MPARHHALSTAQFLILTAACDAAEPVRTHAIRADATTADVAVERAPTPFCDAAQPFFEQIYPAPFPFVSDAGVSPAVFDAARPPEDCVAPCVWDLMRDCPREGACTVEMDSKYAPDVRSVVCWPDVGVWGFTDGHHASYETRVYAGGGLCYARHGSWVPQTTIIVELWEDPTGRLVALGDGGHTVQCGPPECLEQSPVYPWPPQNPAPACGGSVVNYHVDITQPHCSAWRALVLGSGCKPGCCPGSPTASAP